MSFFKNLFIYVIVIANIFFFKSIAWNLLSPIPFPFLDSGFHVLVLPHIVGKEDNYKYLVTLYTPYFRERFTFSVFFFLASLFGEFTT